MRDHTFDRMQLLLNCLKLGHLRLKPLCFKLLHGFVQSPHLSFQCFILLLQTVVLALELLFVSSEDRYDLILIGLLGDFKDTVDECTNYLVVMCWLAIGLFLLIQYQAIVL